MLGIWLEGGMLSVRHDLPRPDATRPEHRDEALVRVLRAGICNTDLELIRGYYPFEGVLGHEFVGRVERGPESLVGKRVVGEINATCGHCVHCRAGRSTHCGDRTVLGIVGRDGCFAEYLTLPAANLLPVPESVSTDHATFTEPLAAALEIQQQVRVAPDDRVLVVGDGKLGLLVAQTLALVGCRLTAVGRHPDKLAILARRGIETVNVADTDSDAIESGAYDLAVEVTGNDQGFALVRRALRPRGTLVMKSTYAGALTLDASSLVVDEITLVGSRCGPFAPALRLLENEMIDVDALIDDRFALADGLAAMTRAAERGTLKILLDVA